MQYFDKEVGADSFLGICLPSLAWAWPGPGLGRPGSGLTWPGLSWPCLAWGWPDLACAWPGKVSECYHFVHLLVWTLPTILSSWPSASLFLNHIFVFVCVSIGFNV